MAKLKMLNIDELAKVERTLILGDVEYDVIEMSVGNFIDTTDMEKRLEEQNDPSEQIKETVAFIRRFIPTLPVETLRSVSFEKLGMIVGFVRGALDKADEDETQVETSAEGEGEKK